MPFDSFLGNPQAVRTVRDMLASGRVPGALLFTGPDGVGKKTLAIMLAKALNCARSGRGDPSGPGGDDFCGECAGCRKTEEMLAAARDDLARRRELKDAQRRLEGLVYFDVQLIEPLTRFVLLEQVRQMRHLAYTRPFELPRRIFILDQAQAVHWQAIDLLLKVLEEPPETTTLILVCPNAYELRPTIRSRCARVQFSAVDERIIAELLAHERPAGKPDQALAVRVAAGSVARAKALDLARFEQRRQPWLDFLDSIARHPGARGDADWRTMFDATRALTENAVDFDETLRTGYALLRDLVFIIEGGAERELINVDLRPRLGAWAKRLGLAGLEKLKAGLDEAYRLQTRNVNQQLGLDSLAVEVVSQPGV